MSSATAAAAPALPPALATMCVNTIRVLAADIVEKANSGHPGAPMGLAPVAHALWGSIMSFDPAAPTWPARDRFVLSNGHACALQYAMLHLTGYAVSMGDLKAFRQLHSITPGHPEVGVTPGVEVSTGPLGQGISNAVGMAIAETHLAAEFNRDGFEVVRNYTYVICGDGCLQEGISSEACSLAGHLGLSKLIVLYDDNTITIDGHTDLSFTEDVGARFAAYGWHVLTVADGSDAQAVASAVAVARAHAGGPTIIKVRTVIGHGSSKANTHGVHGAPLGGPVLAAYKTSMGFDPTASFIVPDDVRAVYTAAAARGAATHAAWRELFERYRVAHPALAAEFTRRFARALPADWARCLPRCAKCMPRMAAGPVHMCVSPCAQVRTHGQAHGHAPRQRDSSERDRAVAARARGRLGGSHALYEDRDQVLARLPARLARRPVLPFRGARARHGRRVQRHVRVWGPDSVRCHVPQLHGLRDGCRAGLRAVTLWGHHDYDPRLDRTRGGRTHAPTD